MSEEAALSFRSLVDELLVRAHRERGHAAWLIEAAHRLEQLDVLLVDIADAVERSRDTDSRDLSAQNRHGLRVKAYAEAFYYFAHRGVDLLESVYGRDSVRRVGRKTIGVVIVRNWLIEHADDPRHGVMAISWEFDTPRLVVLKPLGGDEQRTTFDNGLWANAEELHDQVERLLQRTGAATS